MKAGRSRCYLRLKVQDVDFEITDALEIFEKLLGADMESVISRSRATRDVRL